MYIEPTTFITMGDQSVLNLLTIHKDSTGHRLATC